MSSSRVAKPIETFNFEERDHSIQNVGLAQQHLPPSDGGEASAPVDLSKPTAKDQHRLTTPKLDT